VTDGTTNASIPKAMSPEQLTWEQAQELLAARRDAGPAPKRGGSSGARQPAAGEEEKQRQRARIVMVHIIGGGLAGSRPPGRRPAGVQRRPSRNAAGAADRSPQDRSPGELVCSNSFRGDKLDNAVGLLKEEMRRLDPS
jgi:hypothetical protein